MRYLVLVTDYDGTIATGGKADDATLSAIERLRLSGRRVLLLTGRRVDDLMMVCLRLDLFDYVVAENGAVLYEPLTSEETLLGEPPPARFVRLLRELTGDAIGVGKVIIGTDLPHYAAVLQAIQQTGLDLETILQRCVDDLTRGHQQSERYGLCATEARPLIARSSRNWRCRE